MIDRGFTLPIVSLSVHSSLSSEDGEPPLRSLRSPALDQQIDDFLTDHWVTVHGIRSVVEGNLQRGVAGAVAHIHVGTPREQQGDDVVLSLQHGHLQG